MNVCGPRHILRYMCMCFSSLWSIALILSVFSFYFQIFLCEFMHYILWFLVIFLVGGCIWAWLDIQSKGVNCEDLDKEIIISNNQYTFTKYNFYKTNFIHLWQIYTYVKIFCFYLNSTGPFIESVDPKNWKLLNFSFEFYAYSIKLFWIKWEE